jgi:hypothetical protein
MKLRLLSKSLNVRSAIGNPAMTPASLTIHLAVPWMLFAGNKADVVRSPLPISSSSQLCNSESKTIQGGNIAVMFLSVVISSLGRSVGRRNRVFYENTGFEPLTLVKNPVSLVFMRKS